jgi:hypothetical protein
MCRFFDGKVNNFIERKKCNNTLEKDTLKICAVENEEIVNLCAEGLIMYL